MTQAPFAEYRTEVGHDSVDHNGHMGIRSYTRVFDEAVGLFYRHLGLSREALDAAGGTIFALQETSWFKREAMLGDPLLVASQLIDRDHNKLVTFHRLHQTRDGYVAAAYEIVEIHIDAATRRPAPFAPAMRDRLSEALQVHQALGRPPESGRGIAIPRKGP